MWYVDFILALQSLQFSSGSQDESRFRLASSPVFKSTLFLIIPPLENAYLCFWLGIVIFFFFFQHQPPVAFRTIMLQEI